VKYTTLFALATLVGLTIVAAASNSESLHAQMSMSAPSAGGVPTNTTGNMTTAPTKTDTFSANGIISSLAVV
jgi:hypothetical protein